jgi:hypothetical protein
LQRAPDGDDADDEQQALSADQERYRNRPDYGVSV